MTVKKKVTTKKKDKKENGDKKEKILTAPTTVENKTIPSTAGPISVLSGVKITLRVASSDFLANDNLDWKKEIERCPLMEIGPSTGLSVHPLIIRPSMIAAVKTASSASSINTSANVTASLNLTERILALASADDLRHFCSLVEWFLIRLGKPQLPYMTTAIHDLFVPAVLQLTSLSSHNH